MTTYYIYPYVSKSVRQYGTNNYQCSEMVSMILQEEVVLASYHCDRIHMEITACVLGGDLLYLIISVVACLAPR